MDEIKTALDESYGILTVTMLDLREAHHAGRLGVHVRHNISRELSSRGIGHYPDPLTDSQLDPVRLYTLGSPVADLIGAVLHPSAGNDDAIRAAVSGGEAEVLNRVRELVCG